MHPHKGEPEDKAITPPNMGEERMEIQQEGDRGKGRCGGVGGN